jgi:F-type H+-transporting ATPase subunit b
MPQLDPTYFISQFFWLFISFAFFYVCVHFVIIPKIRKIMKLRSEVSGSNITKARMIESQISELRSISHTKSLEINESIRNMHNEAANKFQAYTKIKLEELNDELKEAHDRTVKEIGRARELLKLDSTNNLALPIAAQIVERLSGVVVSEVALKNHLKGKIC